MWTTTESKLEHVNVKITKFLKSLNLPNVIQGGARNMTREKKMTLLDDVISWDHSQ